MNISRNEFIKQIGFATCLVSCSGIVSVINSCTPLIYIEGNIVNRKIKINKSDFQDKNFVLIKNKSLDAPVFLYKDEKQNYSAVLLLCTHKQCELRPTAKKLICPCHGSEFSFSGKVTNSPAVTDLISFHVSTENDMIYITLS